MKTSRKVAIIIAIAFLIAVVASCAALFSVKKVYAEYTVFGEEETTEIQNSLDKFKGKNLLFFDTDSVYEEIGKYPYYQVISVEKQFPNVLSVQIKKRVETFNVSFGSEKYVLNEEGVVLNDSGNVSGESGVVNVTVTGVTVNSGKVGEIIKTSYDKLFYSALFMAKKAKLSDFVKSVEILSETEVKDVILSTYTGVKITVYKADENGDGKLEKALSAFEEASDYTKTYSEIAVYQKDDGEIAVTWINSAVTD